ncbi:MAG TPA: hypothetical protein VK162_06435 [Streptosporangiaceae bacterium]|nr:hypothetical protein [Streptosporangiaceae bacterium]
MQVLVQDGSVDPAGSPPAAAGAAWPAVISMTTASRPSTATDSWNERTNRTGSASSSPAEHCASFAV